MYNKNYKLTGQNCKCTEEEKETFFSAIKKGTGSNCCRVNSKSMALFLSTPAPFLLLYVKTCTRTDQTSLPLFPLKLKEPSPLHNQKKKKQTHKREKETHTKTETRNTTQKQPTHPPILERKYFSSQVCHCCRLHNHVLKYWSRC